MHLLNCKSPAKTALGSILKSESCFTYEGCGIVSLPKHTNTILTVPCVVEVGDVGDADVDEVGNFHAVDDVAEDAEDAEEAEEAEEAEVAEVGGVGDVVAIFFQLAGSVDRRYCK